MGKQGLLFFLFLLLLLPASAQRRKKETAADTTKDDYFKPDFFRYDNFIYKPFIRTVQLHPQGAELSEPVLRLNSGEKLELGFDDLEGDRKDYSYTFIHCDADWNPSDILAMEYIEGFTDDRISYYRHSINTLQKYTHYNLIFPAENMKITKAGNYILKVYQGSADNAVISRRFMVYDPKVTVLPLVSPATVIEDRNYKQEVDMTISHAGYTINNPYSDLKVVISQNGRWDNAVRKLKPQYVKNEELEYDNDRDNVFTAGNEYRYFDIRSIRQRLERVGSISRDSAKGVNVYLVEDEKRNFKRYSSATDINGKYAIRINEGKYSEAEADYVNVHFVLKYPAPLEGGSLYVFGALSDWSCQPSFRMNYNKEKGAYECTALLKQGYYNYEYAFIKDGEAAADNTEVEGMHYETENNYYIYVYYREKGTFYEQLIGYRQVNSLRKF